MFIRELHSFNYLSRICSSLFCKRAMVSFDFCSSFFNWIKSFFNCSFSSWSALLLLLLLLLSLFDWLFCGEIDWTEGTPGNVADKDELVIKRVRWGTKQKLDHYSSMLCKRAEKNIRVDFSWYMQDKAVDITARFRFIESNESKTR